MVTSIALALAACEPITVDLRSPETPVEMPPVEVKPRETLCEMRGNGCVSKMVLRDRFGSDTCTGGLIEYALPCEVAFDPTSDLICCGDPPPFPPISPCEALGDVCVHVQENFGQCYEGTEPRADSSCDYDMLPARSEYFCCTRVPEPPPPPPPISKCESNGFFCARPMQEPPCPEGTNVQGFDCPFDEFSGDQLTCCG